MKRCNKPSRRIGPKSGYNLISFVRLHATPPSEVRDLGETDGAYVNCWIVAGNSEEATEIAVRDIRAQGWTPDRVEHAAHITREECETDRARELFDQAKFDNEVYEYYTYPPEGCEAPNA
ncbi:MAG: hypothetical protein KF912_10145 [Phycisphaeraceae bacterium]|nr:hypothetical protein [Phycisphaeraceae bacterium]MBX3367657.1 hypothetical protein [Phycisphaeraceae bacterium]